MQAENRGRAGRVVDGHNVKPQRAFLDVAFVQEVVRGADKHATLLRGNAQFGQSGLAFLFGTSAYLDEDQRVSIKSERPISPLTPEGA